MSFEKLLNWWKYQNCEAKKIKINFIDVSVCWRFLSGKEQITYMNKFNKTKRKKNIKKEHSKPKIRMNDWNKKENEEKNCVVCTRKTPNDFRIFLNSFTVRILNVHLQQQRKRISTKWYSFETVWKYCWNIVSLYCILSQSMTYKATENLFDRVFFCVFFLPFTCVDFFFFLVLFICMRFIFCTGFIFLLLFFAAIIGVVCSSSSYSFLSQIHHKRYITIFIRSTFLHVVFLIQSPFRHMARMSYWWFSLVVLAGFVVFILLCSAPHSKPIIIL